MTPRQAGFTLLEILVAALILFSVLATMTEVLRTALGSSVSAEASLALSEAAAALRPQVTEALRAGDPQAGAQDGAGTYGETAYRWRAEAIDQGETLTVVEGEALTEPERGRPLVLWRVELTVLAGKRERTFQFTELSWH